MGTRRKAAAASPADAEGQLKLTYRLVDLPSSQHRAGLVGLVMLTRHLEKLGVSAADAAVSSIEPGGAVLSFTRSGMTALFDAAFATTMGEVERDAPFKNKAKEEVPPLRVETVEVVDKRGKPATKTRYVYRKPIPKGAFLELADPTEGAGLWLKLWRDMLWEIPRGVPATRRPFESRAEGEIVQDGPEMFSDLLANPHKSVELASTYFLGAQANTADNVTFADTASRQLLLHFWPFATELFVPSSVARDGKTAFDGYVFAFPDVSNLAAYCDDYLAFLKSRPDGKLAYRPKAAVIDLPSEAGLRTLSWLARLLAPRVAVSAAIDLEDLVLAVDAIHARKDGNNIRILSHNRVEPRRAMSTEYQAFCRKSLWSHVFRRQCLENLLMDREWFDGFARLIATLPSTITFEDTAFQHDARLTFEEKKMAQEDQDLSTLVYRVASRYLTGMLHSKYGLKWTKEDHGQHRDYRDRKAKLAREALLAMRSRTGDDFIAYVTMTVFSVAQGMSKVDYSVVSAALLEKTETFRTLLMLAFSAQMPKQEASSTS